MKLLIKGRNKAPDVVVGCEFRFAYSWNRAFPSRESERKRCVVTEAFDPTVPEQPDSAVYVEFQFSPEDSDPDEYGPDQDVWRYSEIVTYMTPAEMRKLAEQLLVAADDVETEPQAN